MRVIFIFFFFWQVMFFISSISAQSDLKPLIGVNSYSSRTYLFLGNSFVEKFNSTIDTMNYSWKDSFENKVLVYREYPKYGGELKRIENFEYDRNNKPKRTIIRTKYPVGEVVIDSIIYNQIDSNIFEIVKHYKDENLFKQIHKTVNDTLFIEEIFNGNKSFISREFWETKTRKHSQIIKPVMDSVLNILIHNENGDLIGIDRYEDGNFFGRTMSIDYEYDAQGRIVSKKTYYEKDIGHIEITIY
jgi:hypothetical protein